MGKSLNYEEVYNYVYKSNFILISNEYLGCKSKISLQDFLGYCYHVPFDNFKTNKNLYKFHKSNPYTIQNIKLWLRLNNKPFELISNVFECAKNKLKWKCLIEECNETFESNWSDILHNSIGCPFCAGKQVGLSNCLANRNPKLAAEWHPTKNGDLTPYDVTCGSGQYIWWQCSNNPKHEWEASIYNRNNGRGCPYCVGKLPSKDYNLLICNPTLCEEWDYERNDKNPEEYTPLSESEVWWQCNKNPEHKWKSLICNRSNGNGCPYCSGRYATEENNLLVSNSTLCNEWSSKNNKKPEEYCPYSNKKVWWKCKECGHEWKNSIGARNGKNKRGCPECNKSKGEKKISEVCEIKKITYIPQKTFKGLVGLGGGLLSYDFYLPKYNLLIEYQGEQHEKPVDFNGKGIKSAKKMFEYQQEHDRRKKEYAQKNNIKFLEIWYWDIDKIEEILNKEFIIY